MAGKSKATKAEKTSAAAAKIAPRSVGKTAAPQVKAVPRTNAATATPSKAPAKALAKTPSKTAPKAAVSTKVPPHKKTSSGKIASAKKVVTKTTTGAKPAQARSRKPARTGKPTISATARLLKPTDEPTLTELKETIMATAKKSTPDLSNVVTDLKDKAKTAYEKTTAAAGDASEFAKGNLEAMVESSKILASGIQSMGRDYVEESKSGFETITADMKKIAAVKSPTEFFQVQGELIRRNIDTAIAFSSKSSEKMVKLSNDAIAPLSSRASIAADKISKAG